MAGSTSAPSPVPAPQGDVAAKNEPPDAVSRRVERAVVIAVIAVRLTFCLQVMLAVPDGLMHTARPWLYGLAVVLALAESSLLAIFSWRRQRITSTAALADLVITCLLITAELGYSSPQDRVGTWVAWGFGAGCVATLTVGTGLRRRRDASTAAVALAGVYLVASMPTPQPTTAVVNSVALVGFALGSHMVTGFLRELARTADAARAAAAASAQEAERERQRRLLHDQATVLALLSHRYDNPILEDNLRFQAAAASRRIRAFLGDTRTATPETVLSQARPLLVDIIAAATGDFSDLVITVNTDLILHQRVHSEQADLLLAAIRTLLHNVRCHAKTTTVTIHGDRITGDRWELSVTDDGIGFDPATSAPGYGLSTQAGEALTAAGFAVSVDSTPGDGTRVTISSPEGLDEHQ